MNCRTRRVKTKELSTVSTDGEWKHFEAKKSSVFRYFKCEAGILNVIRHFLNGGRSSGWKHRTRRRRERNEMRRVGEGVGGWLGAGLGLERKRIPWEKETVSKELLTGDLEELESKGDLVAAKCLFY